MAIQHAASTSASITKGASTWRAPGLLRIGALMPFVLALAIPLLAGPKFGGPMYSAPDVAGFPIPTAIGGLTLGWAAFGALVVWTTGSRLAATLAYVFVTVPSIFALILGPAVVLILQNLP